MTIFATNRRFLVGVTEVVAGTAQFNLSSTFPADSDHNCRIANISVSPTIEMTEFDVRTGDDAEMESYAGVRSAEISFEIPLTYGGAVTTEPAYLKYLNACGLKEVEYLGTGLGFQPLAEQNCSSMTIAVFEPGCGAEPSAKAKLFKGCMGEFSLEASGVGAPRLFKFKFKGAYVGDYTVSFANTPILTGTTTRTAEKHMSSSIVVDGVAMQTNNMVLSGGNDIRMIPDQGDSTGIKMFYIAGRKPRLQMNCLSNALATEDVFAKITGEDTGITTIAGTNFTITLPRVQYIASPDTDIEGSIGYAHEFKLLRNMIGTASVVALPDEATFEILQGARA